MKKMDENFNRKTMTDKGELKKIRKSNLSR